MSARGALAARPRRVLPAPPAPEPEAVYLHPGQLFASAGPARVRMVVGSCVAVCLWDLEAGCGGANHFVLPRSPLRSETPLRFGEAAVPALVSALLKHGARRETLRARVFGGASVVPALGRAAGGLGQRNGELALALLAREGIALVEQDLGGQRARRLAFETWHGVARVERL